MIELTKSNYDREYYAAKEMARATQFNNYIWGIVDAYKKQGGEIKTEADYTKAIEWNDGIRAEEVEAFKVLEPGQGMPDVLDPRFIDWDDVQDLKQAIEDYKELLDYEPDYITPAHWQLEAVTEAVGTYELEKLFSKEELSNVRA